MALLTAVRLTGLIFALAIVIEYASSIGFRPKFIRIRSLPLLFTPLGFISYGLFLRSQTGDFWNMFHACQAGQWAYQKFEPNVARIAFNEICLIASAVYHHASGWELEVANRTVPLAPWLAFGGIAIASVRRIPASYVTLVVVSLLVFAVNENFVLVNRYEVSLFPFYLIVADRLGARPLAIAPVLGIYAMAIGISLLLFPNGIWVA